MKTAVDTCILLDILTADKVHMSKSLESLLAARDSGAVVLCEVVFSELSAAARGDLGLLGAFLSDAGIQLERSSDAVLAEAGMRWRAYRDAGGPRTRILPDFLIAAHAIHCGGRLLTRDRGFFSTWFKKLHIIDPSRI
jgi:predicted nucleic acid-binding protein